MKFLIKLVKVISQEEYVTGSELVGLVPKKVLIDAGTHFLKKQKRSVGIHESEIIKIFKRL